MLRVAFCRQHLMASMHWPGRGLLLFVVGIVSSMWVTSAETWDVGGEFGWTIPATTNDLNYTAWAEMRNFRFGDELHFSYSNLTHSILMVNSSSYERCLVLDPIQVLESGDNRVLLDIPGVRDYYFICGFPTACFLQQKLHVTLVGDVPGENSTNTLTQETKKSASDSPSHLHFPGLVLTFLTTYTLSRAQLNSKLFDMDIIARRS